jgi:transposase-like protein
MVQRDGLVHALKVSDTKASTLLPIIMQFCAENSHFFTDELSSYACLDRAGMSHSVIEHGKKEFSKDGITTNSIEGFWGHFKRMVFGTYHFVSKDYLQRYLDEAVYLYNTRKADESARFTDMFCKSIGIVLYPMLI